MADYTTQHIRIAISPRTPQLFIPRRRLSTSSPTIVSERLRCSVYVLYAHHSIVPDNFHTSNNLRLLHRTVNHVDTVPQHNCIPLSKYHFNAYINVRRQWVQGHKKLTPCHVNHRENPMYSQSIEMSKDQTHYKSLFHFISIDFVFAFWVAL